MNPESRNLPRPSALAIGDPGSAVTTAVDGLIYNLSLKDVLTRNPLVAVDITSYNRYRSNGALRISPASSETTIFADSDSQPDRGSVYDFSRVNQSLKSCEEKMKVPKAETKKFPPSQ